MENCKRRCKCNRFSVYLHACLNLSFLLQTTYVMFVCIGFFSPTRDFFTRMETSPLPVKGCKFWPMLGTHGHEQCHTYYDTGHPFIMVISEDQLNSHLLPSVWQWSCHTTCFWGLSRLGFVHLTFRMRGLRSIVIEEILCILGLLQSRLNGTVLWTDV